MKHLLSIYLLTFSFQCLAQGLSLPQKAGSDTGLISGKINPAYELKLGATLRAALENYHYRKLKIDDSISVKAFDQFLKKLDYGKHYLLKEDIEKLKTYRYQIDDQMLTGDIKILNLGISLLQKRIRSAEKIREKVFKKNFKFTGNETIETDVKKRSYLRNEREFEALWTKIFKQATLNKYLSLIEGEKAKAKIKKEKKNKKKGLIQKIKGKISKVIKPEKKLTEKEMLAKAHKGVAKKYKSVFERALKEDRNDHLERYFNSISTMFDPHTVYMPAKRKEDFDIEMTGQLEGIGAVLSEDEAFIKVNSIVPGGAAWRQKELMKGDKIIGVAQEDEDEPVDLIGMRVDDAVRFIRGKKGTIVKLTVKREDGSIKVIPIKRDVVQISASYAKSSVLQIKGHKNKIGYIHLPRFYRDFDKGDINCTNDVRKEIRHLKTKNVNAIILDLRNNGGGALEDAKLMSGLFFKKGPVVQIKNHMHKVDVLEDIDAGVEYDGPLIVMVNRFSASASEILAGALQDYGRAVIVGSEFTHGKGTVQAVLPLSRRGVVSGPNLGALKVTIQKFYRITGASTQFKGVTPDIILPDLFAYAESREQDLDYSLPWDQIKKLDYKMWNGLKYDIPFLAKRSEKRVVKNKRIEKSVKLVDYINSRKGKTKVSLNMKKVLKENKLSEKMNKKFKNDEEMKNLLISEYAASLKGHEKIKKGEEDKWKDEFKQRKEEWVSKLRKDSILEETLYIIEDMLNLKGAKKI